MPDSKAPPDARAEAPAKPASNGAADAKADAKPPSQARLMYDAPATQNLVVSVRGFRVMVALMLVNTVLIASTVLGPQLFPFLRGQWQQWKASRAAAAQARADVAVLQQCLVHTMPEGKVVYEEDPEAAEKLMANGAGAYQPALGGIPRHAPRGWIPPVMAAPPPYYGQFLPVVFNRQRSGGPTNPLLFLHERKTPGGRRHLVTVSLVADFEFDRPRSRPRDAGIGGPYGGYGGYPDGDSPRGLQIKPGETVFVMHKRRMLSVVTYLVDGSSGSGYRGKGAALSRHFALELPDTASFVAGRVMDDAPPDELPKLDYGHRLRFLAGRPDPNDPSHFTIPYQLDGRDGVIEGWLKDSGIDLRPSEGQWRYGNDGEIWRLPAAPATRPAAPEPTPAAD